MKNYIELRIETQSEDEQNILIAFLEQQEWEGFVQEQNCLLAYLAEDLFMHQHEQLQQLLKDKKNTTQIIYPKNWNQEWEDSIQPLVLSDNLCIRTSFHSIQNKTKYEIVITPKMSFGTGHHETTSSMIALMEKINFEKKSVLDFGAGTGILAIFAELLGANQVLAIDNDENCVMNMQENITINVCKHIVIQQADVLPNQQFDIIICNINLNFILQHIPHLFSLLTPKGLLLLSGFYDTDEPHVRHALEKLSNQYVVEKVIQKNKWIAMHLKKIV